MRAAKVQASLRICAVSPEPSLLAHTSSESRATFRQKARSLAPLNGWACAVKICHDRMLEDTNSLNGAHFIIRSKKVCQLCDSLTDQAQITLHWRHTHAPVNVTKRKYILHFFFVWKLIAEGIYAISQTKALSRTSRKFVVKQVSVLTYFLLALFETNDCASYCYISDTVRDFLFFAVFRFW